MGTHECRTRAKERSKREDARGGRDMDIRQGAWRQGVHGETEPPTSSPRRSLKTPLQRFFHSAYPTITNSRSASHATTSFCVFHEHTFCSVLYTTISLCVYHDLHSASYHRRRSHFVRRQLAPSRQLSEAVCCRPFVGLVALDVANLRRL